MIRNVINIQDTIGRCGRNDEREDQVGTIQESIILENHISIQIAALTLQAREGMDKIKSRDLSELDVIKTDI